MASRTNRATNVSEPNIEYYDRKRAERLGRRAGSTTFWCFGWPPRRRQQPFPALDDPVPPGTVKDIASSVQSSIHGVRRQLLGRKADLDAAVQSGEKRLNDLEALLGSGDRSREVRMGLAPYLVLMTIIGVAEAFFNSLVFQLFQMGRYETWLLSAAVGVAFPLGAHFVGAWTKQDRHHRGRIVIIGVMLAGLLAVVLLRSLYLEETTSSGILNVDIPVWLMTVLFLFVNVLIISIAAVLSHAHAATDPQFERNLEEYLALAPAVEAARQELAGLEGEYYARCAEHLESYKALAGEYRDANIDARRKAKGASAESVRPSWPWCVDSAHEVTERRIVVVEPWAPESGYLPQPSTPSGPLANVAVPITEMTRPAEPIAIMKSDAGLQTPLSGAAIPSGQTEGPVRDEATAQDRTGEVGIGTLQPPQPGRQGGATEAESPLTSGAAPASPEHGGGDISILQPFRPGPSNSVGLDLNPDSQEAET